MVPAPLGTVMTVGKPWQSKAVIVSNAAEEPTGNAEEEEENGRSACQVN